MSPSGSPKPPPEERLLKLIRAKPARPEPAAAVRAEAGPLLRAGAYEWPWSRVVIPSLAVLFIAEAVWLGVQLIRPVPPVTLPRAALSPPPSEQSPPTAPELPSLAASAARPLFTASPAPAAAASASAAGQAPPSGIAKSLSARLSLTGVVAGDPPQAIIEDTETQKTYFVTVGQTVVEGAVVEQILDQRVVLNLQGEKIDLNL